MLCLYLLGQHCLHLTLKPYWSSETYSRKYEKLPNIVHACKNNTETLYLLKMSGPQIWLFLFTFRPIESKKLNGLNTSFGCKMSRVQSPAPERVFMFDFLFCCCCVFTFLSKTHYLSQKFTIPFTILIYLVYLLLQD